MIKQALLSVHTLFIATLLLTTGIGHAQENSDDIEALKQSLPDHCVFTGHFSQSKQIKALPVPLLSSGKLFFSCQHGLIWHNDKPFAESLIYTEKNLHFRTIPGTPAIPLSGPQHDYLATFLLDLLSANTKSIEEQFNIDIIKSSAVETKIQLLPSNAFIKKGLSSIQLKKTIVNGEELLAITITDNKAQVTALNIGQLNTYSKQKKWDIGANCGQALANKPACDILSDPYPYQTIDSNN